VSVDLPPIRLTLPEKREQIAQALFPLHRQIDGLYRDLPWPAKIERIVVLTDILGGRGDISAAAKVISFMQSMCPTLMFDWVLKGTRPDYDPRIFLTCEDRSKIHCRWWGEAPPEGAPADFMLTGPVKLAWDIPYIESRISRKIAGPTFGFMENGEELATFDEEVLLLRVEKCEAYPTLHATLFPSKYTNSNHMGLLPMGLLPGSGVFVDPSRVKAPLSREYNCPSYLLELEDGELLSDIVKVMNKGTSFNFGYAHYPVNWGKYIDCIAIHEQEKDVVLVLNQQGEYAKFSIEQFRDSIFTPERCAFLKQKGYDKIVLKGDSPESFLLQEGDGRSFTAVVRPFFKPPDVRRLQLSAERLLATGDNSAVEAWSARCKLYLYEDIETIGCKWRFLQQQVDLAKTVSPNLGKLLALFGGDRRLPDPSLNKPLTPDKMAEMEALLHDPELPRATLQFCNLITTHYSFYSVLEGALKRAVWHHCLPELAPLEATTLDPSFQLGLLTYLKTGTPPKSPLIITTLPELGQRIHETVQKNLSSYCR